jgi:transposase
MGYSDDLRRKVIEAWLAGRGSQEALAAIFGVSRSWIQKILRHQRRTGETARGTWKHGPAPRVSAARYRQAVARYPAATLPELGRRLGVSAPTVCRTLKRLGITRKKRVSMRRSGRRRASSGSVPGGGARKAASHRGGRSSPMSADSTWR